MDYVYEKYKISYVMTGFYDAYAFIAPAVIWVSRCFVLRPTRKLQKRWSIEVNGACFNKVVNNCFQLGEVSFYHLFKYFKLIR